MGWERFCQLFNKVDHMVARFKCSAMEKDLFNYHFETKIPESPVLNQHCGEALAILLFYQLKETYQR